MTEEARVFVFDSLTLLGVSFDVLSLGLVDGASVLQR